MNSGRGSKRNYVSKALSSSMDVCAVIPAYNEACRIGETLDALFSTNCFNRIIVVDDGSSDNTFDIAISKGVDVIRLSANHGKAHALKRGFFSSKEKIIVFLDVDLGSSASEVYRLLEPILDNRADVTVARFPMSPGKGGFGFVKHLAAAGIRLLTGKAFPSVLSGQRAFSRWTISREMFDYKGFGVEFGMTVDLLNSGARLIEVDVQMNHRTTGRDLQGFVHRYRQFKDILAVLVSKLLHITP
jgi:glycosyltransferase involved in cell wall biosynthesis